MDTCIILTLVNGPKSMSTQIQIRNWMQKEFGQAKLNMSTYIIEFTGVVKG